MVRRRSLAAVEVELVSIPVQVAATPDESARTATPVIEDAQCRAPADNDRAGADHQLALLRISGDDRRIQ